MGMMRTGFCLRARDQRGGGYKDECEEFLHVC
jgi:hypothetical protein